MERVCGMSEMTTTILVYNQELHALQDWVKRKKKQGFLLSVAENWTCLLIENDLRTAEKWAGTVSKELGKPVLYLGIYDEFGWRADFWEAGVREVHIDLPFERPRKAQVDLSGFAAWQRLAIRPEALEQLREALQSPRRMEPGLASLLKEAFGLELLQFISYDYVSNYSEEMREARGIVAVSGQKTPKVRQAILDVLQEPLGQLGYRLDPASGGSYMPDEYRFFTDIGSYRYQISVNLPEKGKLVVSYIPPYQVHAMDHWHAQNGLGNAISYTNELQLRTILLEVLRQMTETGIPWLQSHRVEEVNLNLIFERTVTPVMKERGYLQKDVTQDDTYSGSRLFCYGSEDGKWRILFSFSKGFPRYWVYVRRYREALHIHIDIPRESAGYHGDHYLYRTEAELERQLSAITERFFELIGEESSLSYSPELSGIEF